MKSALYAIWLIVTAGLASAQDVYVGGSLDYQLPHSGDAQSSVAIVGGARFGDGPLGYGLEAEYGQSFGNDASYDAARLRAIATYEFGPVTGLATAGVTQYSEGGNDFSGTNFGLGAELPYGDKARFRFEMMRDLMDDDFRTDVTTTRAGVMFNF